VEIIHELGIAVFQGAELGLPVVLKLVPISLQGVAMVVHLFDFRHQLAELAFIRSVDPLFSAALDC